MGNIIVFVVKFYLSIWFLFSLSIMIYVCFYNWIIPNYSIEEAIFFHHDVACTQMLTLYYQQQHHQQHQYYYYNDQKQKYSAMNMNDNKDDNKQNNIDDTSPSLNIMSTCTNVRYDIPNKNYRKFFRDGHDYYFKLELRMPDSQVNRNLGMFMIRLCLFDENNNQLYEIYRPAILPYNSWLLSLAKMITFIPLYLIGWLQEMHTIQVNLLDEHSDVENIDFSKINRIRLEVETLKPIEIIPPSRLTIQVNLSGYKYLMYWWPLTTSVVTIASLFIFLLFIYICSFFKRTKKQTKLKSITSNSTTSANNNNNSTKDVSEFFNDSSIFDDNNTNSNMNNNNPGQSIVDGPDSTSLVPSNDYHDHHHHHHHLHHQQQPQQQHDVHNRNTNRSLSFRSRSR